MTEMKDSGIAWIGSIPVSWDLRRLKACFLQRDGGAWGDEAVGDNGDVICLRIADFDYERFRFKNLPQESYTIRHYTADQIRKLQLTVGDILIEKSGGGEKTPVGRTVIFDKNFPALYANFMDRLKCHSSVSPSFMQYVLVTFYKNEYTRNYIKQTTGIQNLDLSSMLANEMIALPGIEAQNKIVAFLDRKCAEIDSITGQTRDSISEYKKLKQAVISQAVTKGIRGDRAMKESGIKWAQQIPVDWNSINPKALFTQRKDKARPGERQLTASQQHGVIYQDEYMALTGSKVVTVEKDFDILKHVEAGDFVISMRSFQGGLEYSAYTGSISSAYVMLIPNLELVEPRFFRWLLKSSVYINALQSTSNLVRDGQAMRYSNFAQVRLYTVPMEEQREIADYLDRKCAEIDRLIAQKEQFLAEIENYKKTLIYEYVTGKKEVPAERTEPVVTFIDARALLVCRIVELMKPKGRIHLQKAMHMVDCLLGLNKETQYSRHKHGPYDVRIQEYEQAAEKKSWIKVKQGSSVEYSAGAKLEEYRDAYLCVYGDVDVEIQKICAFLAPMKTSQSERVATLLAAWNDFLLDGIDPTDRQLIQEVRTNWTPNKANSPEATWLDTLNKIRKNGFVPAGKGLRTITAG